MPRDFIGINTAGFFPARWPDLREISEREIIREWEDITGEVPDVSDDSEIMAVVNPLNVINRTLWRAEEGVYWSGFAETAAGAALVDRVADRVMAPHGARPSRVPLLFKGSPGETFDPDAVIVEADNGERFQPVRRFTIRRFGDAIVPAQSVRRGSATRIAAGGITTVLTPSGLEVENRSFGPTPTQFNGAVTGRIEIPPTEDVTNFVLFNLGNVRYPAAVDGFTFPDVENPSPQAGSFYLRLAIFDHDSSNLLAVTAKKEFQFSGEQTKAIHFEGERMDWMADPTVERIRLVPLLFEGSHGPLRFPTMSVDSDADERFYEDGQPVDRMLRFDIDHVVVGRAQGGRDREGDAELRLRRREQLWSPGAGTPKSIRSRLFDIPTINFAEVLENPAPTTDDDGVPPYATEVIVHGSVDKQEVGNALAEVIHAGQPLHGNQEIVARDEDGQTRQMAVTFAADRTIYYQVRVILEADFPADITRRIKDALIIVTGGIDSLQGFHIGIPVGQNMVHGDAVIAAMSVDGVHSVDVQLGRDPNGTDAAEDDVAMGMREKAVTRTDAIAVSYVNRG